MTVGMVTPACPVCREKGEVQMTDDQWHWYIVTGLVPTEWDAGTREQAMTGIHPQCSK